MHTGYFTPSDDLPPVLFDLAEPLPQSPAWLPSVPSSPSLPTPFPTPSLSPLPIHSPSQPFSQPDDSDLSTAPTWPTPSSESFHRSPSPDRAPSAHKRRRTAGKPRSHSQIDARRRQKEAAILRRLEELTEAEDAAEDEEPSEGERARCRLRKREKLAVLQSSVDKLERLQALVDHMTEAANARDERVQALVRLLQSAGDDAYAAAGSAPHPSKPSSSPSSLLPRSTLSLLTYLDGQHSLYSEFFVGARLSVMVIELSSGKVVDANALWFVVSGWERRDIIDRLLANDRRTLEEWKDGPLPEFTEEQRRQRPLVKRRPWLGADQPKLYATGRSCAASRRDKEEEEDAQLELVPCPRVKQYPASLALARQLAQGKITTFTSPWRCVGYDGHIKEHHVRTRCTIIISCAHHAFRALIVQAVLCYAVLWCPQHMTWVAQTDATGAPCRVLMASAQHDITRMDP